MINLAGAALRTGAHAISANRVGRVDLPEACCVAGGQQPPKGLISASEIGF
ncbi:MAG: hypothetical protein CM15mP125_3890 [Gammaproteobacteria bacterium]|nr:MAG: hypothetical protein CM15mP125_3890 [Gammaproteobacteria bacterium]